MDDVDHNEQPVAEATTKQSPVEVVTLRHPHTEDTKQATVGSEELLSLMGRGYAQVKGA